MVILFEKDVKNKNTTELEYVLLDNNLNKISSDTFFENNYENAFHKPKAILSKVKKIKNDLLIEIATQEKNRTNKFHHRYRKLNLNDFSLSDAFVIQNKTVKDEIYAEDKIIQISEIISNQNLETTKGSYFIVYDLPQDNQNTEIGLLTKNKVKSIKGFTVLDSEFNSLWHKPFSDYYETLLSSDSTKIGRAHV